VIEFKKITINDYIQAMTQQALTISMANYRTVRILSQKKPGATLKVARDPPAPGKKPALTGFLKQGSSRISHGTLASGTGEPTHLWATHHSLATPPKGAI